MTIIDKNSEDYVRVVQDHVLVAEAKETKNVTNDNDSISRTGKKNQSFSGRFSKSLHALGLKTSVLSLLKDESKLFTHRCSDESSKKHFCQGYKNESGNGSMVQSDLHDHSNSLSLHIQPEKKATFDYPLMRSTSGIDGQDKNNDNSIQKLNSTSLINEKRNASLVLVGCILLGSDLQGKCINDNGIITNLELMQSEKSCFFVKVSLFNGKRSSSKRLKSILHCRKIIHKSSSEQSKASVITWNSSFLSHLPRQLDLTLDRYLQFIVYCIDQKTGQNLFVGQNTVEINDPSGSSSTMWLPLYKWDNKTQVKGRLQVTTEVFWPSNDLIKA